MSDHRQYALCAISIQAALAESRLASHSFPEPWEQVGFHVQGRSVPDDQSNNSLVTLFLTINPSPPPSTPLGDTIIADAYIDGILIEISDHIAIDMDVLLKAHLHNHPSVGMLIFGFNSYRLLETATALYPALRNPLVSQSTYILAYRGIGPPEHAFQSEKLLLWTAVDPVTLEATGMLKKTPIALVDCLILRLVNIGQRW